MFPFMDASLKNVCTASLGIKYTAYHTLGMKQIISLRYEFKLAQFKSILPLIFLLLPIG